MACLSWLTQLILLYTPRQLASGPETFYISHQSRKCFHRLAYMLILLRVFFFSNKIFSCQTCVRLCHLMEGKENCSPVNLSLQNNPVNHVSISTYPTRPHTDANIKTENVPNFKKHHSFKFNILENIQCTFNSSQFLKNIQNIKTMSF